MASEAQVVANRRNAAKSTGPRTPEGKAVVAQNAVKHGLLARQAVIVGEDPGEYEFYRDQMVGELAPVGLVESMLAERVVSLSWRLRRAERLQNEAFDALYLKETTGPLAKLTRSLHPKPPEGFRSDGDPAIGRVVLHGFSDDRVLDRLMMYERRIELSLYKAMAELQQQRLLRELNGPAQTLGGVTPNAPPGAASPPGERPHHSNIPSFRHSTDEDRSRQTKPISAGRDAERPPGREATADSAKQSQSGGLQTNRPAEREVCETMRGV